MAAQKIALSEVTIVKILSDITKALLHLHLSQPPVAFRDLNVSAVPLTPNRVAVQRSPWQRWKVEVVESGQQYHQVLQLDTAGGQISDRPRN